MERCAEEERLQRLQRRRGLSYEYSVHPLLLKPSQPIPLMRFSCVGFVMQAYRGARMALLTEPSPERALTELQPLYPDAASSWEDPETCSRLGIGMGDASPVALVGYVLHALQREPRDIRAATVEAWYGDEYFRGEQRIDNNGQSGTQRCGREPCHSSVACWRFKASA